MCDLINAFFSYSGLQSTFIDFFLSIKQKCLVLCKLLLIEKQIAIRLFPTLFTVINIKFQEVL